MEINNELKIEYDATFDDEDGLVESFELIINNKSIFINADESFVLAKYIMDKINEL